MTEIILAVKTYTVMHETLWVLQRLVFHLLNKWGHSRLITCLARPQWGVIVSNIFQLLCRLPMAKSTANGMWLWLSLSTSTSNSDHNFCIRRAICYLYVVVSAQCGWFNILLVCFCSRSVGRGLSSRLRELRFQSSAAVLNLRHVHLLYIPQVH